MKKGSALLSRLAIVLVALLVLSSIATAAPVKNVIMLIGDGMGMGATQFAQYVLVGPQGRLEFQKLPNIGLLTTYSANNWTTDSAAAGTALATGYKTNNGMISVLPDGKTQVQTILEVAQKAGKAVGMISTNTIYDATPAAFGSHWGTRGGSDAISQQLVEKRIDVLLGGGSDQFLPKGVGPGKRTDNRNLVEEAKAAGYSYAANKSELAAATGGKILGLFNPTYMNYLADRDEYNSQEPSLREMTAKALEVLTKDPDGFFLMSEGARIDHAAHAGDIPGVIAELADFNNTVADVLKWAEGRDDTLVVVTADHDTYGLAITEPLSMAVLNKVKASPEYMGIQMKKDANGLFTPESVAEVMAAFAGITDLTPAEMSTIQAAGKLAGYKQGYVIGAVIAARANAGTIAPGIRDMGATGGHTATYVAVYANKPGTVFGSKLLDNTDVPKLVASLMGLSF